jgi:DNA-directed RNA polymerase specialized sigma subunit
LTYALRLAAIRARTKRPIREEIESAALLGLTLAARRWDSRRLSPKTGKPVIFSTYMVHAVTSAINREIATQRAAIARRTCAPDELEFDDDGKLTGARRAGKPYQLAAEREDEAIILAAIGQLRPVHQAILHARIDGATFREIGDQIGRTKQGAQQIMATAQRRLTKLLAAS